MDFDDTEEDASFRREVSVWLKKHAEIRTGRLTGPGTLRIPTMYAAAASGSTPSMKGAGVP